KFLGGELDAFPAAMDLFVIQVHFEIRGAQEIADGLGLAGGAFEKGPDLEQELAELKGLYEVVVGAGVIPFDLVVEGAHGGEHDDEGLLIVVTDGLAKLVSIHPRKIDIEDDELEGPG